MPTMRSLGHNPTLSELVQSTFKPLHDGRVFHNNLSGSFNKWQDDSSLFVFEFLDSITQTFFTFPVPPDKKQHSPYEWPELLY